MVDSEMEFWVARLDRVVSHPRMRSSSVCKSAYSAVLFTCLGAIRNLA
jgi:hypothetical protein